MSKKRWIVVRTWDEALDAVDGARVVLDGVPGVIRVERNLRDAYGPLARPWRVSHVPSEAGRRTEAYLATRRRLRDDYTTDLSDGDRLVEVMGRRGIVFEPSGAQNRVRTLDLVSTRPADLGRDDAGGSYQVVYLGPPRTMANAYDPVWGATRDGVVVRGPTERFSAVLHAQKSTGETDPRSRLANRAGGSRRSSSRTTRLHVFDVLGPYEKTDPSELRPVPGGDSWRGTLHAFVRGNAEWLSNDPATARAIRGLRPGRHVLIGGGAAPWVAVVRTDGARANRAGRCP